MAKKKQTSPHRAILVGASPLSPDRAREMLDFLKVDDDASDLLIGVDGGVETLLQTPYIPDLAIGDWDSLKSRDSLKDIESFSLKRDKDISDLGAALQLCKEVGATEVFALGVSGGRRDHELASWYDLAAFAHSAAAQVTLLDPNYIAFFVTPKCKLGLPFAKGTSISVFAIGGSAKGVTLKGFRFPLTNATLECSSRGLSNVSKAPKIEVSVKTGKLMVMINVGVDAGQPRA